MFARRAMLVALAALAVLVAGCGTTGETTTTNDAVTSAEDVVFGQGELPETVPEDFPLPLGSVIGSTMVVTKTGFTEISVRVGAEQGITAEYFNQALLQAGFSVDRSEAADSDWVIEFSRDGAKGTIDLGAIQESATQAVIRYNVP